MKTISTFKVVLVISASFVFPAVGQPSLGTSSLLEGPGAGSDSVVLAMAYPTETWTATANDAWLHLSVANQSGVGSTNVVFSYDANPGATRTNTLTIAGQTLTVTQAGATYVAAPVLVTTLVSGLSDPAGVAVDGAGSVYIADTGHNTIKKWMPASQALSTLVASGLHTPGGVAVDGAGNVYIGDTYNNAIKEWVVASNTVTTLVGSGLSVPGGVALDGAGNVYIADNGNAAVREWTAANNTVSTLVSSGLNHPFGVAVDAAGNVYIADTFNNAIKEWVVASNTVTMVVGSGLYNPQGVAVDGAGNVYIADTGNSAIKEWVVASNTVITLVGSGLNNPEGVAVDGAGAVYIADALNSAIKELPRAFLDPTPIWEGAGAGSDMLPVVLPATANLLAPFAPSSDSAWLTVTGVSNGVVSFAYSANTACTNRTAHITLLGRPIPITQGMMPVAICQQPVSVSVCAGSPAVFTVLAVGTNLLYQWQVSQDGGNTFTDISATATNAGYTNLDSMVTEDGDRYQVIVSASGTSVTSAPPAVLTVHAPATASTGGDQTAWATNCVSLGGSVGGCATGGVWTSTGSGRFMPNATTVNATYCPSTADEAQGTVTLRLTSRGTCAPCPNAAAQMMLTLLAPPTIVSAPINLTVCGGFPAVFSVSATGGGLTYQWQVSQDGGNTFTNINAAATNASYTNRAPTVMDNGNQYQVVVSASGASVTSAPPAVLTVNAPATASAGGNQTISAGNATTGLGGSVGGAATGGTWSSTGTGSFAPNATTLNATYTLSASDITAGIVMLTLSSTGQLAPCPSATAKVVVSITRLGTTAALEGPGAGVDSVVLAMPTPTNTWTATANAAWLHLSGANQSGTGSTNVVFSYDANPGTTRTGTLTIAGQTLTVTQASSAYVTAPVPVTTLVASGLSGPASVAVDGAGNVYMADTGHSAIKQWTVTNNTVTTLIGSGLNQPQGVAVDGAGNVFIADTGTNRLTSTNAIKKWTATNNAVSTLASQFWHPEGVSVDRAGNVFITDSGKIEVQGGAIWKWTAANQTVNFVSVGIRIGTTVWPCNDTPHGVAVDAAGNLYFSVDLYSCLGGSYGGSGLELLPPATNTATTLTSAVNAHPGEVAVDGAGNVYVADSSSLYGYAIKKWTAASSSFTTLVQGGLYQPRGVAVDSVGNVYIADAGNNAIKELPRAFVDPTAKWEGPVAGSDVLPVVLPATANLFAPFAPTSDHAWLTITGITNGVVSYSFSANTGANRTAYITLLGQPIAITQAAAVTQPAQLTVCAGSPAIFSAVTAGGGLAYQWQVSRDNGITFTNISATTTNASYTNLAPTLADNGNAYQVIVTSGGGVITSAPPSVLIVNAPATASAGTNQTICGGSATAALGGTVSGGATGGFWSSSGSGSFVPSATALSATYSPSVADVAAGTVTLALSTTGQLSPCTTVTSQVVMTINPSPTASAGANQATCAGSATAGLGGTVGGGATGGTWSSSGTGSFAPNATTLNATYTPSAGDITAGTVTLTLSTTGQLSPCGPATAQVVMTINPLATASAGANQTICAGSATPGLGGTVGGSATGGTWSSSGTGSFAPNATTLNATYTPSAADITAGTVTLTLSSTGQQSPCGPATAQAVVTIHALPAITSQPANATVFLGSPAIFSVAATGVGLSYQWQVSADGGTTFTNVSDTATNASYTNATTTLADDGKQYQVIVEGACPSLTSTQAVLTVDPIEAWVGYSYALLDPVICSNSQVPLSGSLPSGTTGFEWVGAGTFYPSTTTLDVVYTPTGAENSSGSATVTLLATNPAWPAYQASASVTVTIVRPATVSAGANQTVCADSPQTQLAGSVEGTEESEQLGGGLWWWYGAGDFLPDPTVTNAVYTPTAAEIAAGQATLTLSAYGPWPCWEVTSTMTITINPAATASAGPNQTICAGSATAGLGGTVGGGATGGLWTSSGTGTFVPDPTTLNAAYTPSGADCAAGSVTLTMTCAGQQSTCGAASAQVVLTIIPVALTPPILIGPTLLSNGLFQFAFSNNDPGASFTVLTTTNPWLPLSNWTVAGPATNTTPGVFQFSTGTTHTPQGFYRVRSP